jgi:hypothetical protein
VKYFGDCSVNEEYKQLKCGMGGFGISEEGRTDSEHPVIVETQHNELQVTTIRLGMFCWRSMAVHF